MFRSASVIAMLFFIAPTYAVEPPKETDKPVAKLTGPAEAKVGEQLIYSTEGSIGQDIQFSISPPTQNFIPVKLMDGKDTPGVIHTPSVPGTYQIYTILNNNGKTAFVVLTLKVTGGSGPPSPNNPVVPVRPDGTFFNLKDALEKDRGSDAMAGQTIAQLEALFGQWDRIGKASNGWEQFTKTFKDAGKAALDDKLPNSRRVIAEYIGTRLPQNPNAPYDINLILSVRDEILQTIKASK